MRVLQLGPLYVNHVHRWAERARSAGWAVDVAGHVRPGRAERDFSDVADRVEVMPGGLADADIGTQLRWLETVVERLAPDVIQAHWLPRWGNLATRLDGRPVVATGWGSDVYLARGSDRDRGDAALRAADRVIARSRHMRAAMLARGADPARTAVVDLGVDLDRFRPPAAAPREPVILSFRAGTSLYNVDVVVEAFRVVRSRVPQATLVVLRGDAPLAPRVRSALDGADARVVAHVPHGEMPRHLRAATVGVSIPSSDGSPSSVWEALACGLPVVASDLPQVAERVGASGAVRLVAPERDGVAAALLDVLIDAELRAEMAAAARTCALERFDARAQAKLLARVYAGASSR